MVEAIISPKQNSRDVEPAAKAEVDVAVKISPDLGRWLKSKNVCLLISSYQSGLLFTVGVDDAGRVAIQKHAFDRAMGISTYKGGFIFASLYQIWRFNLARPLQATQGSSQTILIPQSSIYTGFVNCHDVVQFDKGQIVYVATKFNCLATVTEKNNLTPIWAPPFFKTLAHEDCCHVNGLAKIGEKARFVSMLGTGSQKSEWRKDRSRGAIYDLKSNRPIASNLWMPHSPRVNQQKLYALESGVGSFGAVSNGKIGKSLLLPGFTRGLDFHETMAAIGYSHIRSSGDGTLPLEARMKEDGIQPGCGIVLFDTTKGKVAHSIEFLSGVSELYDVAFLAGTSSVHLVHPNSKEMLKTHSIGRLDRKIERASPKKETQLTN